MIQLNEKMMKHSKEKVTNIAKANEDLRRNSKIETTGANIQSSNLKIMNPLKEIRIKIKYTNEIKGYKCFI